MTREGLFRYSLVCSQTGSVILKYQQLLFVFSEKPVFLYASITMAPTTTVPVNPQNHPMQRTHDKILWCGSPKVASR